MATCSFLLTSSTGDWFEVSFYTVIHKRAVIKNSFGSDLMAHPSWWKMREWQKVITFSFAQRFHLQRPFL